MYGEDRLIIVVGYQSDLVGYLELPLDYVGTCHVRGCGQFHCYGLIGVVVGVFSDNVGDVIDRCWCLAYGYVACCVHVAVRDVVVV